MVSLPFPFECTVFVGTVRKTSDLVQAVCQEWRALSMSPEIEGPFNGLF